VNPDVSRAAALVKAVLNLEPGPELDELQQAAATAATVAELPSWARAVLTYARAL